MEHEKRNLTDGDVEALAEALRCKVVKEFYQDLGRGVFALVWRAVVMALIAVAAYGAITK
jgi:hypothetical protein